MIKTEGFAERTSRRAAELRRLHSGPEPLLLPNVWDAVTA